MPKCLNSSDWAFSMIAFACASGSSEIRCSYQPIASASSVSDAIIRANVLVSALSSSAGSWYWSKPISPPCSSLSGGTPRPTTASWTGTGWVSSRGSCRFRSARSRSAMSWVNPRRTTTRQRGEVLAVLREGVRRDLPAALAQRVRDVEDREVLDLVLHLEREDRQLVSARDQLERADLLDLARRAASRRPARSPGRRA